MAEVSLILDQIRNGEPLAAEAFLPLVYDELRRLASAMIANEFTFASDLENFCGMKRCWTYPRGNSQQRVVVQTKIAEVAPHVAVIGLPFHL